MGCDIHAFIEYEDFIKADGASWISCWAAFVDIGRNYELFALMAGVRYDQNRMNGTRPIFEPRGIPTNIGWRTKEEYLLRVTNDDEEAEREHYCSQANAQKWVAAGVSKWYDVNHINNPDWHSASYLTADELQQVHDTYVTIVGPQSSWYQSIDQKLPDGARIIGEPRHHKFGAPLSILNFTDVYVEQGERTVNKPYLPILAVIAAMRALDGDKPGRSRLVFWFDN